jgi:hypothetical protein
MAPLLVQRRRMVSGIRGARKCNLFAHDLPT